MAGAAWVGIAVTAVSTAYSVYSQKKQADYVANVEGENQKSAMLSAADAIQRGDIAADEARQRTRLLIAQQRAGYAASGVDLGVGSPTSVTADTAMFGELDALTLQSNARREAWGYTGQAGESRRRAGLTKLSAKNNQGSTLLTGASQALSQYSSALDSGAIK